MYASLQRRPQRFDARAFLVMAGIAILATATRQRAHQVAALPQWISLQEASLHSGLSVGLLNRLVALGKLKAIRDGQVKVRRTDLDRLDGLSESLGELRKSAQSLRAQVNALKRKVPF